MNFDQISPTTTPPSPALQWLARHGDVLYRFALRRVGRNSAAAEDLVQETLLAALQGHRDFEGRSSERTWLVGILRNKIVDYLRRAGAREQSAGASADARDLDNYFFDARGRWRVAVPAWDASGADPHRLLERSEFRAVLSRCMSKLPARTADVFWQREAEGVDTAQICQKLQVSRDNVWTLLHRARLQLRHCLSINWFAPDDRRPGRHKESRT